MFAINIDSISEFVKKYNRASIFWIHFINNKTLYIESGKMLQNIISHISKGGK